MIVLDTTVLVYAVGADHDYREPARELLSAVADGRLAATTTVEVLQEFTHVRARRRGRDDAAALAESYADLLSPLLAVTGEDLRVGLRTFRSLDRIGAFDAVLAAAALRADATALVSADTAFSRVPRLTAVVPDARGIARLLDTN